MVFAGPGSRTPVTGAPYSAVQVTQFQQTLEGGNQVSRQVQTKVYRDSQGRVRMERTATVGRSRRAGGRNHDFHFRPRGRELLHAQSAEDDSLQHDASTRPEGK